MSVASIAQHHGPWTVADVLALPEDRTRRYELLGESLVMSPAPGLRHQRAGFRLHVALDAAAEAGAAVEVLEAINVTLPSGLVVPDIVVADSRRHRRGRRQHRCRGRPAGRGAGLPGNKPMDRKVKPLLYAEAGIPHYWRLEFDPAPRLICCVLEDGRYVETATALPGVVTLVEEPFPFAIDPAGLAQARKTG